MILTLLKSQEVPNFEMRSTFQNLESFPYSFEAEQGDVVGLYAHMKKLGTRIFSISNIQFLIKDDKSKRDYSQKSLLSHYKNATELHIKTFDNFQRCYNATSWSMDQNITNKLMWHSDPKNNERDFYCMKGFYGIFDKNSNNTNFSEKILLAV
jgi:hypothetical protein